MIKVGNTVVNESNVIGVSFQPASEGKPAVIKISFVGGASQHYRGETAEAFWNKFESLVDGDTGLLL